jgi:mRNA-degrading endonuclease RelE of RelBE toxin-antitoxin system
MSYQVRLSKAVRRRLNDLPGNIRNIARQRIIALAEQPRPHDAKELEGHSGYYRVWLGANYRLAWQIIEAAEMVDILYVGLKLPDLYRGLGLPRPLPENDKSK